LILDEDGLYNPGDFNDRLLLGLKGTMSEAELHVLRARLQGGIRNKARRGELRLPLPVGLVYDAQDRVVLDPDRQVQRAIRTFFKTYQRLGSALGVVRFFNQNDLSFPRRLRGGPNKGQLIWGPLIHTRALQILRNPRYTGAYVFGRTRVCRRPNGRDGYTVQPQENWHTLIPDAHPGYISWQQYQDNRRTLRACAQAHGQDRLKSPPGQGPALLQGLVVCGVCGRRMTVRYHQRYGKLVADYMCQRDCVSRGHDICQQIPGHNIDCAIGELLLEMVQPATVELAFAIQAELQARLDEVDQLRRQQVERARYEAESARNRYMQVDPRNRLVADALEADWNNKLRALSEAQEQYEQQRQTDQNLLDEPGRRKVMSLARDLPRLWRSPHTSDQERKRMVRLLIEDVTLTRAAELRVQIRFKAGATRTLTLPLPTNAWQQRMTNPQVVSEIDRLLDACTEGQIVHELNRRGYRSGTGHPFTLRIVSRIRRTYHLKSRYDRLRAAGMLTVAEIAQQLDIHTSTVKTWRKHGLLIGHPYNDKSERLYEPVGSNGPVKQQGAKLSERRLSPKIMSHATNEVYHEA
jgi:DNA invertase Pin-like site-specific DNA recombinase